MKKKKIITICACLLLLFAVVGITYAAFTFTNTGSANTITSGKINFSYTEPSNSYTIDNAMPTYDSDGKASTDYFEFVVSSNATTNSDDSIGVSLPFEISIESVSVDTGKTALDNDEVKVYLTSVASGTETEELTPTLISELADSSYSGKLVLSGTHTYKNNSSAISTTYRLRAWIDSDVDVSSWSTSSSYQYKFKINVNASASSQEAPKPKMVRMLSGNVNTIGSEVAIGGTLEVGSEVPIGSENFYVIGDDPDVSGNVLLLAKYNLKVGSNGTEFNDEASCAAAGYKWTASKEECEEWVDLEAISSSSEGYNKQSSDMRGYYCDGTYDYNEYECDGTWKHTGVLTFSSTNYWYSSGFKPAYGTSYPAYVYDSNSNLYNYIENYKDILEDEFEVEVESARLLKQEEAVALGCDASKWSCQTTSVISNNRQWIYNTSTWLGSASDTYNVWYVYSDGYFFNTGYGHGNEFGVRPVISVSKTLFD